MSNNTKQIYVISVFPEIVENFIKYGVLKRSQDKDLLKINMINLRDFSKNKGQIDDKPYGGGAGMVLQAQPLIDATRFAKSNLENYKCIYLSPKGRKMNQKMVAEASVCRYPTSLALLCLGHCLQVVGRVLSEGHSMDCL